MPPLDALQAVTGDYDNYDVEFGNAQGLVTILTTKMEQTNGMGQGTSLTR